MTKSPMLTTKSALERDATSLCTQVAIKFMERTEVTSHPRHPG